MAQPTGTYATNDMVGIREDLADVIYDISPTETPFLNSVPHVEATAVLHEWQTDSLAAAANNAAIEGDDAPADSSSPTSRLNNRTQISTKDARVSGTGQSVNTAGRADELDYQMLKRGRELRRDMETALLDNNAKVAGDDTTPRELAGVPAWIATNTVFQTGGTPSGADPTGDGTDARTDNSTTSALTNDMVKEAVREAFESGGMPDVLMAGPFVRQAISGLDVGPSGVFIKQQRMEDSTLRTSFEIYESDFGALRIIPNRFQRARDLFALQMDMWAVAFLPGRNMATFDIAKTGDSDARQILSEYTLEARNEAASAGIYDLDTA